MRRALATCLLLSAAWPAQATESVDLDTGPAREWLGSHHYGVFRGDRKVGWLERSFLRSEWEGEPAVERSVEMFLHIAGDGTARRSSQRTVFLVAEPQLLVHVAQETEQQGRAWSRTATRREGRFHVVTTSDGDEKSGVAAAQRVVLSDELGVELLIAGARNRDEGALGASITVTGFDVRSMLRHRRTLRLVTEENPTDENAADLGEPRYGVSIVMGEGRVGRPALFDARGALVEGPLSAGLSLRRMPEDEARSELDRVSLAVAARVPLEGRLGDISTIRKLVLRCPAPKEEGAPMPFATTARQQVAVDEGLLSLTVSTIGGAGAVTDEEREAALQPEPGIDSDAPSIRSAAQATLRGTSRPAVRVRRLLEFVATRTIDMIVIEEPGASEVLRTGRGDCTEHARLFVALSRASGIAAREVHGLVYLGDAKREFAWHAWAEVELQGEWRPVDPVGGEIPAHAGHLRVTTGAWRARVLDDLRLEVVEVSH